MKNSRRYFTTGEFAKIFGIKKQTLFHYDHCGIFCPDIIGENGYRYYSFAQLETFAVISMLRELDVSIAEIKQHIDSPSPENLIALLEAKKQEASAKILRLRRSQKYLENKIRITREGISASVGSVIHEDRPEAFLVTTAYTGDDDETEVMEAVGEHFAFYQSLDIGRAYPIGAIIPVASVSASGYKYSEFYTQLDASEPVPCNSVPDNSVPGTSASGDYAPGTPASDPAAGPDTMQISKAEAGSYIAIYDDHGYSNIHQCCLTLLDYARAHNLKTGSRFYEDVILDDLSTGGYYNYLVKLSVRVE